MPVKAKMHLSLGNHQRVEGCTHFLFNTTHPRSVLACLLECQGWEGPQPLIIASSVAQPQPTCFRETRRGKEQGTEKKSVMSFLCTSIPGLLYMFARMGDDFHFTDLKTEALGK